jgi:hypothetical protein
MIIINVIFTQDDVKLQKILESLEIPPIPDNIDDNREKLKYILTSWLPLSMCKNFYFY